MYLFFAEVLKLFLQIKNEKARTSLSSMQRKRPIPFPQKFPNADPLALVLLKKMLAFDPDCRPSAEEVKTNITSCLERDT